MRKVYCLVATALAFAVAAPALAQSEPPIGSRLGKRDYIRSVHDPKASVRAAHRMAGCTYLKQGSRVNAALASLDAAESRRIIENLGSKGTCINLLPREEAAEMQRISYSLEVYRGMLAEAALRQNYSRASLPPLPRERVYSRPWFAATGRPNVVDEMAACVADTNPAGVQALLSTMAETAEEGAAVSRLMPSMGPCLTVGAKLNANRQSLRASLAEALYHRFRSPTAATPAASPTGGAH